MWFMLHNWIGKQVSTTTTPRVWVLLNHRAGENAQVVALAEALGWPFEIKRFSYRKGIPYLLLGASVAGIKPEQSDPLTPPWPDLIISASSRNEPVCRWIQKQAAKTGKRVRLVHIGRPWNPIERFDLVITTPQYRLPQRPNVLHNSTTLHRVTNKRLVVEGRKWRIHLAHLPRPYIAVMIGGDSGPYVMDGNAARRLAEQANRLAEQLGGSLLVTTSARTPAGVLEAFAGVLTVPAHLFGWSEECGENPYYGYLALADQIVVTSDTVSMLTEACATRKPVHIFDLGQVSRGWKDWSLARLRSLIYRLGMKYAPRRLTRDLSLVHRRMIADGRAVWLGQPFPAGPVADFSADMNRAVCRVRGLFREQAATVAVLKTVFS
jgi:Predicted nucleoside-diphosphate-sugar epimerase